MPKRYAYNTSATQVKKRYAMIGSTATQIKKKYAMIGSTATLVYSAEEYLLQNGVAQTLAGGFTHYAQQYNSELTYPSGYMQLKNSNSGSYSRVDSNNEIDWSKYSTLKVQMGATTVPTYSTFVIAIAKGTINSGTYISSISSSNRSLYKSYNDPSASITWAEDHILSFDVSSITTSGKFMIGMIHNIGTWKIKNIWVE